jgi:hypothetical protein
VLSAFEVELEKEAAGESGLLAHLGRPGVLHAAGGAAGAGLGLGALAGGALGAARGARERYLKAREEGAGAGRSAARSVAGAAEGALGGAGRGALYGAAGGALAGVAAPLALTRASKALFARPDALGAASRFGARQVHGLTGFRPGGSSRSLEKIRGGSYDARKGLEQALLSDDPKRTERALRHFKASEEAARLGLTSLPGLAKALSREPGRAIGTAARAAWSAGGPGHKAMLVGVPAAGAAGAVLGPEEPGGAGPGERAGRALGAIGYTAAPLALAPSVVLGALGERAGGAAGRLIDRQRSTRARLAPERRPLARGDFMEPFGHEPGDLWAAA